MLKIEKRNTYRWTVEHAIGRQRGKDETVDFDLEFKALRREEVDALFERMRAGEIDDAAILGELVVGWARVQDADGKAMQFTPEALAEVCNAYPGMSASIARAWSESVTGAIQGAARKN